MSAWCEWSLSMSGRNRNKYLDEILTVLCEIENIDKADYDKIFQTRDGKAFRTKELTRIIYTDNSAAKNIFGENYLEPKVDFCLLIAKAVPKAKWVIESSCTSESGGEGCESYMIATYEDGKIEFKTEVGVDTVALAPLVQMMNTDDDSYESFCSAYVVDDSIDEDTYDEYKYDDCEDDFYYNSTTGTVSRHHIWNVTIHEV